jgi:hypothetical protein
MVGQLLAQRLRQEGVDVRLVDPQPQKSAFSSSLPLYLPTHPEHPHRLEAALGSDRAAALIDFIAWGRSLWEEEAKVLPLHWRPLGQEASEMSASYAASKRLGLEVSPDPEGYWMAAAVAPPLPQPEIHREPVAAEVDIFCTGATPLDPFLHDKIMPVRQLALLFAGSAPATLSYHASLRFLPTPEGLWACGAREATPHLEVGETEPLPSPKVRVALERITRSFFPELGPTTAEKCGIYADSCDGLPIVGPVPGRPRSLVCAGLGMGGYSYARPCVEVLVSGLLSGNVEKLPPELSTERFR